VLRSHLTTYAAAIVALAAVNVLTAPGVWWAAWPAWAWGMVVAAHVGAALAWRSRLFGAHAGLFAVANLGFVRIDLAHGGHGWYYWPLVGWGILLAAHAGLVVTGRDAPPPGPLSPSRAGGADAPAVASGPGTLARPGAPRSTSRGLRLAEGVLALIAAVMVLGAAGYGVGQALTLRGSGVTTVVSREVGSVQGVVLRGTGELIVTQAPVKVPTLTIEGDTNLVPRVETSVANGQLTIEAHPNWLRGLRPDVPLRYRLTVPEGSLESLELTQGTRATIPTLAAERLAVTVDRGSACTIRDLEADEIVVTVAGGGALTVAGRVGAQTVAVDDAGDYAGRELVSRTAIVTVQDAGSATVAVSEALTARVDDAGYIGYVPLGDPGALVVDAESERRGEIEALPTVAPDGS